MRRAKRRKQKKRVQNSAVMNDKDARQLYLAEIKII
jgi:hypothetical protein